MKSTHTSCTGSVYWVWLGHTETLGPLEPHFYPSQLGLVLLICGPTSGNLSASHEAHKNVTG